MLISAGVCVHLLRASGLATLASLTSHHFLLHTTCAFSYLHILTTILGAAFTCIDCMTDFQGNSYMAHTSCMSEAQKYQGHLYRPEKEKKGKQNQNQNNKQNQQQGYNHNQKAVQPYVSEEIENQISVVETMPEAPTPPSAVPDFEAKPNVFDFYAGQATPNVSTADLTKFASAATAVVKFDTAAETPAPKKSKKKDEPKSDKKDKKRKRLHVDTSASPSVDRDLDMPDIEGGSSVTPGLHTGLTGGLKQLMERDVFPPTPTDSGDAETPIKRKKSDSKKAKKEVGLMARMGGALINSSVGRRTSSGSTTKKEHEEDKPRKKTKAIEASPAVASTEVVAYADGVGALQPEEMASQLMALVPVEEEKSMSMDKALKRYHRMRAEAGGAGKAVEEKELWKALRMKRNDRGEIVLFFAEASA